MELPQGTQTLDLGCRGGHTQGLLLGNRLQACAPGFVGNIQSKTPHFVIFYIALFNQKDKYDWE
jgi:hypothetical protein